MSRLLMIGAGTCVGAPPPPATFPVVYAGRVEFVGAPLEPVTVRLTSVAQDVSAAEVTLDGTTGWFRLEARVPPGDWMVESEVAGAPPPEATWWRALGPRRIAACPPGTRLELVIERDG